MGEGELPAGSQQLKNKSSTVWKFSAFEQCFQRSMNFNHSENDEKLLCNDGPTTTCQVLWTPFLKHKLPQRSEAATERKINCHISAGIWRDIRTSPRMSVSCVKHSLGDNISSRRATLVQNGLATVRHGRAVFVQKSDGFKRVENKTWRQVVFHSGFNPT